MTNANMLKSKIARIGYTQRKVSAILGISERSLSMKINNKLVFNTYEIDRLCEILEITDNKERIGIFLHQSPRKWDEHTFF